ncbi:ComEC/Rec2 family competence protein [Corynebacterium uberis]|uniref:ComEC/Rec2 family competence protein n=1 Tax=Corynebacterium TaxID=1716 RepID=UPI001D0A0C14|nr:ComEC/Rec2 family competence protein [Corynebacterium uberis]MCZ9310092.1 ComEC/Rec2 family competence protein [Corynebacterium sp. c6VSa_13]UDL75278.1 ComEC/Rec2 family competence protein [Corynebacterium uberis]UDL77489.1 ComEC/Rec2 family competence protein [Corynebacterium uberis]UDL79776.1 ComEC/Rec2 family competence protein [Corynebacterium uberis]UDL84116.1 ComEC/Rec2 family competence protein [Corynebacterium uberis]
MNELRLVPVAAAAWLICAAVVSRHHWVVALSVLAVAILVAVAAWLRQPGQAVILGVVPAVVGIIAQARVRAGSIEPPVEVRGALERAAVQINSPEHPWLLVLRVAGRPGTLRVISPQEADFPAGTQVVVRARWQPVAEAGVNAFSGRAHSVVAQPPSGWAGQVADIRSQFRDVVTQAVSGHSRGLVPGMVVGDTSLEDAQLHQACLDTGLSHLSAVSGANVTIVCSCAIVLCRWLTLGPRVQAACALGLLLVFCTVVGPEASVLRAAVTGTVGVLAVVGSSRVPPIHGLCLAVVALVGWDSQLACQWGFALSVGATAGIVALFPAIYGQLACVARWQVPDVVVRAVAVAVAADVVTAPLIAAMAGKVPVVSVVANVAVAAMVPPVTVVGLIAVVVGCVSPPIAVALVRLISPCTWWIGQVAVHLAALPGASLGVGPVAVLVAYGWVGYGWATGRVRLTCAVLACAAVVTVVGVPQPLRAPAVDMGTLTTVVVDKRDDALDVPPGTQLVVVRDASGAPARRPTVTPQGVPVVFPARDGPVEILRDGTQRAADGRF